MLTPLERSGIDYIWYDISERFLVDENVSLGPED